MVFQVEDTPTLEKNKFLKIIITILTNLNASLLFRRQEHRQRYNRPIDEHTGDNVSGTKKKQGNK